MKPSLKTKLSLIIAIVVLVTVILISILANLFIEEQFNSYLVRQQKQKTGEIVSSVNLQYNMTTNTWDTDVIHTLGMAALYSGYIIEVKDSQNQTIWDARAHDMSLCTQVMEDISNRMERKYPQINGGITSKTFPVIRNQNTIGSVNISYFGPYFLSENDFRFLESLNVVLIIIGIFVLFVAIAIGLVMAKHLSRPILKTVDTTKQIADGNYGVRVEERTNTKEIELLVQSINHLAGTLGNQEKLRKQLTEDISHELRTPVAVLQSHVEAMIEGVWQPTVERLRSCEDEIRRIGNLVSELEKLAKIDSDKQKLNMTEINLAEIINKMLKGFEVIIKDKELQVTVNGNCSNIWADGDKISQVIVNLLSNAVKYTEVGGKINIDISETVETVVFCIQDDGVGISGEELPFIFERFYRADKSRNRKTGGSGLGLAIVKSIVETHKGKVSVISSLNKGSYFEVCLPKGFKD